MNGFAGGGTALVIFALTYVVLGFGALPPLRIDRTGATLIGATAMIAFGVLAPSAALASIDFHTIALLFGMMVVVAHLRSAGFFLWLGAWFTQSAIHDDPGVTMAATLPAQTVVSSQAPAVDDIMLALRERDRR